MTTNHKKNFLVNVGTTSFLKALGFFLLPIYAYLYSSEDFGVYGTVVSFIAIVNSISSLRLERFIPIASDSEQALKISRVVIVLSLIVGLFSFIGFFIYSESLEMTKIYERLAYSFLVFIGIFSGF